MDGADTPSEGLADIVVTAERRSESLQTTPVSISAVTGDDLRARQIVNLEALSSQIPNVQFGRKAGDAFVFIRGLGYDSIAPGGETRVAVYSDNIYQPRTQAAFQGFYDVDRVEVLRGPQGTLYGRNATAGAVNILTREPGQSLDGFVTGRVGNYGLIGTEGALGGPLSPTLSARLAFQTEDRNGYGKNIGTGEDVNDSRTRNVRLKLKFEPASDFSFGIIADYGREMDHSGGNRYIRPGRSDVVPAALRLGGTVATDPQDTAGFGPRFWLETYGIAGEGRFALGASTELVSLTGLRHLRAESDSSIDNSTLLLSKQFLVDDSDSFSQEVRLSHKFGDVGELLVGGYYFRESNFAENLIPFSGKLVGRPSFDLLQGRWTQGNLKTNAYAAFGQVRVHVLPQLTLTLGGRYSYEKKSIDEGNLVDLVRLYDPSRPFQPSLSQKADTTESRFDPRVTLDFKPSERLFFYLTYSRGFKSGGFNVGGVQPAFKPEVLQDYEAGVKVDLLDRRLRVNAAAFHYIYKNLQVNISESLQLVTRNAAAAKVDGAEVEITALPVEDLRLALNASYLHARYSSFFDTDPAFPELGIQDLKGNRLNYSPKWKVGGEVGYTVHADFGQITPRVNVTWVDKVYFSQFNLASTSQRSWANIDANIGYESLDGLWSGSLFVKNLTDHTYILSSIVTSNLVGFPVNGLYGAPRTFGASVTRRF